MENLVTVSFRSRPGFADGLRCRLGPDCEWWGPVAAADGICRLLRLEGIDDLEPVCLPAIPMKKLLLPAREPIWSWDGRSFQPPASFPRRVLFGAALCDLRALWYLDQVFGDDPLYRERRERLLVVAAPCQPAAHCRCLPAELPVAADLFWSKDRIWGMSDRGRALLATLDHLLDDPRDLPVPLPEDVPGKAAGCDEQLFKRSAKAPLWQEQAKACLSCGACSAVCPTCFCYDMIDTATPGGTVSRLRVWDNCFFADHGEVAGGHDFRPDRAARLRFRFEHKKLGFGALRGRSSCVGCGRCLNVCPAGIDLDRISEQLLAERAT